MPDSTARPSQPGPGAGSDGGPSATQALANDVVSIGGLLRAILRRLRRREKNEAVREAIEELIEETPESDTPISEDQRVLLANILKLRDKTVRDVMVPRVDIVGIAADTPLDEVVRLIQAEAHSRYPVHRESLLKNLAEKLPGFGVAYVHLPDLGGLRRPRPDSPNAAWRNRRSLDQ